MSYQTEQKKLVIKYLEDNLDKSYSIEELVNNLNSLYSSAPGKSSVYRIVNNLLENGVVRRFTNAPDKTFYYQAVCKHTDEHLHLVCKSCNKLIHLDKETSLELKEELKTKYSFAIDSSTTLPGLCEKCK